MALTREFKSLLYIQKIRIVFLFVIILNSFICHPQQISEQDLELISKYINNQFQKLNINSYITPRACYSIDRTLIYAYDVAWDYELPTNLKEILINNFKQAGFSDAFFNNDIDLKLLYFKKNDLIKSIDIRSTEFSDFNFELGDYLNIKECPKAKGVDLQIKQPIGWKMQEGERPNIVLVFSYKTNSYLILIKDYPTFLSRKESLELLSDTTFFNNIINDISTSLVNFQVLNKKIVTVDRYPTLEMKIRGNMILKEYDLKMMMKAWITIYEDKIIFFIGAGRDGKEFQLLENFFNRITNSVVFPEQYL